ncbi:MAG: hypothetical protein D6772_17770, partial [Bacteroidetes bacterium]
MSDEETSLTYLDYGKGGGSDYGATTDWLAFDRTGGYAPGEGTPLPEDLILSNDACLSDLRINDVSIPDFDPQMLAYTVNLPSFELPEVTWTTRSAFATAVLSSPSNPEGSQATVTVTADDEVTTKVYTINYVFPRDEPWVVYRANARLDQETDFWELRDIPAMPAA